MSSTLKDKRFALILSLLAALALVLSTAGVAFAKGKGDKQDKPCKADIERLCGDVELGGGRIAQCLVEHESELSTQCQERVSKGKEKLQKLREACESDLQQFCASASTKKEIRSCLKEHRDELSESCKAVGAKGKKGGNGKKGGPLLEACQADIQSLCSGSTGRKEIRTCMQSNREKLSAECTAQVEKMETKGAAAISACGEDAKEFCADVEGRKAIRDCLADHESELSLSCTTFIEKKKEARRAKKGKGKRSKDSK
ncbi:MAG: hypothetical protein COW42_04980 [Deltaproteobacteria bacterium CG17_big_fil_post_rev_8_21_14_2_50_63_7]|nr:MAG: hypothetical protein COW42_04980 [Deltaproteobacteria bacterium CG17_big_fil_post_rev_8_21_14_2_50_63_7]